MPARDSLSRIQPDSLVISLAFVFMAAQARDSSTALSTDSRTLSCKSAYLTDTTA